MEFIDVAREFLMLVSGELDPHTSKKGQIVVEGPEKVSLFTPSHIQFAKYGRGPGKNPPRDQILEFVKDKGIIFDGLDQKGTAIAIQLSIGKKGTLNYVPNAPNAMDEALDKSFERYSKALSEMFAVNISEEVNEIWEENIPLETKFKI